jgi:NAD(P)-dependent dehydrogenase (short-subunit alcohol dehydrogenase family)
MVAESQVVLLTGASGGVGRAVAREMASSGYDLGLLYRSNETAARDAATAAGRCSMPLQVDLTQAGNVGRAVAQLVERFGKIDALVHFAGANINWKPVRDLSSQEWEDFPDADLNGFFNVLSSCLRRMHHQKSGVIVAISSIPSQACQPKGAQAAAAKAAPEAVIRVVAKEEGRHGIRANAVAIGLTATALGADAERHWGEEAPKRLIAATPLGRNGKPEEITRVIAFLASDEASYVTGKVLQVGGGQIIAA